MMDDMSTPIEVIRNGNELPAPLDTRGGGIDPNASLDYNELLRKASEQAPEQEPDHRPPQQMPQQMSQPPPHQQFNLPVMEPVHVNMPHMTPQNHFYDSYPIQNRQPSPEQKLPKKEKPNKFDEIQKEFIIVLISSLFINSSIVQSFFLKHVSVMFSEGNITTIGVLINAILVGLIIVGLKNIQFSIS